MKYRLMWRSKRTGVEGHGDWMAQGLAEAWLTVSQRDYPQFDYWLERKVMP